jgi:hypothetical protein
VSCTAVKVQPKEGDTVDRQKYYQLCRYFGCYNMLLLHVVWVGVRSVVSCTAVKVQPKEGDTVDRQKYYQVRRYCCMSVTCYYIVTVWFGWGRGLW